MSLTAKKVLVTGGGSGYGKGIASVLKNCGAEVWITGRNEEKLQRTAAEIGVNFRRADAASPAEWDSVTTSSAPAKMTLCSPTMEPPRMAWMPISSLALF